MFLRSGFLALRAKPMIWNSAGRRFWVLSSWSAGKSFSLAKSPEAPKIMKVVEGIFILFILAEEC